jgi:hypothetical protein
MKILMIGNKESGKTTYMASAFGLLEQGQSGFFINSDSGSTQWFKALFQSIKNGMYPALSDKRSKYAFELYHYQKKVLEFEWIDYYGGIVTEMNAEQLVKDIDTSDGIILFLEAAALLERNTSVTQLRRILALITYKLTQQTRLYTVIIVITKYDKILSGVSLSQIQEPLQGFLSSVGNNENIYTRVIPVSCTKEGFFNVELPLLDMLDSGLKTSYLNVAEEVMKYSEQAKYYADRIGVMDWIVSKVIGADTNREMAEGFLQKATSKLELFESLEVPMTNLSNYVSNYQIVLPNESTKSIEKNSASNGHRRRVEL